MPKLKSTNDAVEVMRAALEGAKTALAKTQYVAGLEREVGVVDSGGGWSSSMKDSCQP